MIYLSSLDSGGVTGGSTFGFFSNWAIAVFKFWIAVATSSMPATGVALPFISYGGTSLTVLMGEIGIVLNISKKVKIN